MTRVGTVRWASSLLLFSLGLASRAADATLVFEANRGQADSDAAFLARADSYQALVGSTGVRFVIPGSSGLRAAAVELGFIDADASAPLAGTGERPERVHYLSRTEPHTRISDVPTFDGVSRADVYPGVAVAFRGEGRRLAIELTVSKGADPSTIRLGVRGARGTRLDPATGELVATIGDGAMRFAVSGDAASFVIRGNDEVGLVPRAIDGDGPLVLRIVATAWAGPRRNEDIAPARVATDADGNAYVTGRTPPFPGRGADAFVTKIAHDGSTRLFTTYFGARGATVPAGISVDRAGEAVIVGSGPDAFIAKLAADGSAFVFAGELGAEADGEARAVALDRNGSAWVAGRFGLPRPHALLFRFDPDGTQVDLSSVLATLDAEAVSSIAFDSEEAAYLAGSTRVGVPFVAKLDPRGKSLRFATMLGNAGEKTPTDLAVDGWGVVRVVGSVTSGRFATSLASDDGALQRDDRFPDVSGRNVAGLAVDGDGGTWMAGGGALALRLARDGRIVDRVPTTETAGDASVTGIAAARDGRAFVAGIANGIVPDGFQQLASSSPGGTVFVGLVPFSPNAPEAAGCPGSIQFTNGGGTGLWQTPGNWNLGHVPLGTDDVCIPAGFAVTLSSGPQAVNSVYVAATSSLVVSASLSLAAASQFDGTLTLQSSGTLTGTGDISCMGAFTWTGGTITGASNFFANVGVAFSGASVKDLTASRALITAGTTTWTGPGGVRVGSSASITNNGTWDCQSDAQISSLGSPGPFTNSLGALFKKSAGVGATTVAIPFTNTGSTTLLTGTLNLSGGGTYSGSLTGSPGTILQFGGGTHTFGVGSSVSAATALFDAGTVTIGGTYAATTGTTISGATVNFNLAGTVTSIGSALTISSGTANFVSGEVIAPATLTFSSGTLQGTDTVNVSGLTTWTGGTMTGAATTNTNGGLAFAGASVKDLTASRTLITAGTTTWAGPGGVRVGSSASITNNGTWDCQSDAQISSLGSPGPFTNSLGALFKKSAGVGATTVAIPFTNTGTTTLLTGTLNLSGGGTYSGSLTGSPGTILQFDGGTHTLGASSSINAATVLLDAGIVNVGGAYAATTGTTISGATANFNLAGTVTSIGSALTISSGTANFVSGEVIAPTTLTFSSGTLQGTDTVNVSGLTTWTGGTMTGAATTNTNGGLAFAGASVKDLTASRTLITPGTTTWAGAGGIRVGSSASITNNGTWDCQSDAQISSLGSPGPFTNSLGALFKKSAGVGATTVAIPFTNTGSTTLLTGTLNLSGGGTYSGSLTGSPGTILQFGGGTHTFGVGSSVSAATALFDAGTVTIGGTYAATTGTTISGAIANFNLAGTVTSIGSALTISSGTANFVSGEVIAPATLTFSGGTLQGTDTVNVSGLTTWTGGTMTGAATTNANGGLAFAGATVKDLTASRALNTAGATTLTGTGGIRIGTSASITNNGTWDCQSDAPLANLGSAGPFTNGASGVFKKTAGAGTTSVMTSFVNAGAVQALTQTLGFGGGYTQTAGSTTMSGGAITSSTAMDIQGGTITGVGTATANVVNAGHAVPGLPIGVLTVSGNYTQSPAGSFDVQLGGRIAGTEYDQLNLTGSGVASFSGALNVVLTNGLVPIGGDAFTLMNYSSSTGSFTTSSLPPLAAGCWRTFYNPTSLVLEVWTVTPETTGVTISADKSTVSWNPLTPVSGPAATYDLMRGALSQFPVGGKPSETCIAPDISTTSALDATVPSAGTGFYYLVRGVNGCGPGGYGTASNGTPRTPTTCP